MTFLVGEPGNRLGPFARSNRDMSPTSSALDAFALQLAWPVPRKTAPSYVEPYPNLRSRLFLGVPVVE
jgi:hypothetical protein